MTLSRCMLQMMPRTVTVQAFSALSTDGYGSRTHSTDSKSVRCYIEDKIELVRDPLGRESKSTRQVYAAPFDTSTVATTVRIGVSDKLTLPVGYEPNTPAIINVTHFDDRLGFYAQVVYL